MCKSLAEVVGHQLVFLSLTHQSHATEVPKPSWAGKVLHKMNICQTVVGGKRAADKQREEGIWEWG